MICPMLKGGNTAPPCKRDGGDKGTGCAWWDGNHSQCSVISIVHTLEGIERVLAAVFEFEQLKKIIELAQDQSIEPTILERLKKLFADPERMRGTGWAEMWYGDNEEAEDLDVSGADHAGDLPPDPLGDEDSTDEEEDIDGES